MNVKELLKDGCMVEYLHHKRGSLTSVIENGVIGGVYPILRYDDELNDSKSEIPWEIMKVWNTEGHLIAMRKSADTQWYVAGEGYRILEEGEESVPGLHYWSNDIGDWDTRVCDDSPLHLTDVYRKRVIEPEPELGPFRTPTAQEIGYKTPL